MSQAVIAGTGKRLIALPILGAISFCHVLNDMMQALLPAVYPILKGSAGRSATGLAARPSSGPQSWACCRSHWPCPMSAWGPRSS